MQIVQLFVNGEQVDMFKDESITISDSIANIKDISKIYTAYSRQFTLPASPTNNRIFKHYYNFNVIGGFDARFRVAAYLNVNGIRYKDGKLRLSGVKLKDNSPESYQVTFFGNTVALKDLFGEDTLSTLVGGTYGLNNYNHLYDDNTIRLSFNNTTQIYNGDVKYCFISHSRVFRYDGSDVVSDFNGETLLDRFVSLSDLKPSLRLKAIVSAIEEKYDLTFSTDFFNTAYFKNLYMWLHKEAGPITATDGNNQLISYFSDTSVWITTGTDFRDANGALFVYTEQWPNFDWVYYEITTYTVTLTGLIEYTVAITDSGSPLYSNTATGTNAFGVNTELRGAAQTYELEFTIDSASAFSATQQVVIKKYTIPSGTYGQWVHTDTSTYTAAAADVAQNIDIPSQMPNMKVYDFMINLFKMHQLTASIDKELNGTETVNVLPLPQYQSTGVEYDITDDVDVTSTQVDRLIPYKEINFSYQGRKSALISAYDQAYPNNKFGDLNWNAGTEDMDGGKYSVQLGFEHMYFERIRTAGFETSIQYGVMIDQNLEPIVNLPLIHCIVLREPLTPNLKWNTGTGQATLIKYNSPTNIDANDNSIHWGAQFNEYTGLVEEDSLYTRFYSDTISAVFQQNARKFTYKAYLPLGTLLSYNLNDRFRIGQNTFKIESVNTNLQNEESTLVLFNDLPPEVNITRPPNVTTKTSVNRPTFVKLGTPSSASYAKLEWRFADGATEYLIYLNGKYLAGVTPTAALVQSYEYTSIDLTNVNILGVQAFYGTLGSLDGIASIVVSIPSIEQDIDEVQVLLDALETRADNYENATESHALLTELNEC